jgi:hypothetical protein
LELYRTYRESLLLMGAIVLLFFRLELKKKKLLRSLDKKICCGIKYWGILKRRAFDYYMVKLRLKVCIISIWIFIYVNIVYMGSIIG